jgi:hypothetical protein
MVGLAKTPLGKFTVLGLKMINQTRIAWALIRKWADYYEAPVPEMKRKSFKWAMKLACKYIHKPVVTKRQVGRWLDV